MKRLRFPIAVIALMLAVGVAVAAPLPQEDDGQEYIVQADDWLSKLAQKFYGDSLAYQTIVEATNAKVQADNSFTVIDNPDLIEVGQKLWIPATAEGIALPVAPAASPDSAEVSLEEQNKALVLRLYSEVLGQNKTDLVEELLAPDYIQHNATVPGGAEGQIELFENLKAQTPGLVATVKHVAADGDLVAVHWHASATPEDEATGQAVVDLFRLAGGKIVEHWDVYQDVPATTASGNSLFSDVYQYPQGAPALSEAQEEANEQMAAGAYSKLFNERSLEVLDQYWDPQYFQHNPLAANGTDALKQFLQSMPAGDGPIIGFSHTLSDQDLVWVFLQAPVSEGGSDGVFGADIFRVVDGKIIEHWDVIQGIPPSSN